MEITEATRKELQKLIDEALEQKERKIGANKRVFRDVCCEIEPQLKQFDHKVKRVAVSETKGIYEYESYCEYSRQIQNACADLLRVIYKVHYTKELPAEHQKDMKNFMLYVLDLMALERKKETKS